MKNNFAKTIRVLTVPPVMALLLVAVFWSRFFTGREAPLTLLCLCIVPTLAYLFVRDRDRQRRLAFILSGVGYVAGFILSIVMNFGQIPRLILTTYLISVLILTFFNQVLKIKASGHACGIAGPIAVYVFLLGGWSIPVGLAVYAASFWASVCLKRHTVREFLLGTSASLLAFLISVLFFGF